MAIGRVKLVFVCLLVVPALRARAQDLPAEAAARDRALAARAIEELGSKQFAVRERATERLILLGLPAVPLLEQAQHSQNREVAHRSRLVLAMIGEVDFQNRLEAFEADGDPTRDYGLPGWQRFRELAGATPPCKSLFAQMQRAEAELLVAESQPPAAAAQTLDYRCQRLRYSTQLFGTRHPLPHVAAALFVATNDQLDLPRQTNAALVYLCSQPAFYNAYIGEHGPALERLLARWIPRDDNLPAHEALKLAMQYDVKQALPRARQLAAAKNTGIFDRHLAILSIAKFGGLDDVPLLESQLDDEAVCASYRSENKTFVVQVRDIALAGLLQLSKQDPLQFSYARLQMREPYVFNITTLGFSNEDERQLALTRWHLYRNEK